MLKHVTGASSAQVIARIETLKNAEPGGAIAFDGDGTLWSGDIGEDLFYALIAEENILPEALRALVEEARSANLRTDGTGGELAKRIDEAHHQGAFPEERLFEIMTWLMAGRHAALADAYADQLLDRVGLADRLHPEAIAIVRWAKENGVRVFLVSASPRIIVEQAAKRVGIDLEHVASAADQRTPEGIILPAVDRPIPYGAGKVRRLREKLADLPLYAAFGDNAFDLAMLAEARIPVAVRPKARLLERAPELPALVVLDRE